MGGASGKGFGFGVLGGGAGVLAVVVDLRRNSGLMHKSRVGNTLFDSHLSFTPTYAHTLELLDDCFPM